MKNDAVRMMELIEGINTILVKYADYIDGYSRKDMLTGAVCFECSLGKQKLGTEDHPFWTELWAYLEPHVDVHAVKEIYPNIGCSQTCKNRKISDLLRTIAEHMLPAQVLVEQ